MGIFSPNVTPLFKTLSMGLVLNITLYVFIECQHQCCPHYCLGQETGATLTLENMLYHLQHVQFVTSRLTIFAALPSTIERSIT